MSVGQQDFDMTTVATLHWNADSPQKYHYFRNVVCRGSAVQSVSLLPIYLSH